MIEDAVYIIVDPMGDDYWLKKNTDQVQTLIKKGYKVKHTATTKIAVHWLLVKYKPGLMPGKELNNG